MAESPFDIEALGAYLEAHVDGFRGLEKTRKFPGGQSNPTFLLTARSGQYVLRRQPEGKLLKSAHAVDREYRVMTALRDSDVPVPRTWHLCEDRRVLGSLFFVMSYADGRVFWDPALPDLEAPQRSAIYAEMNRVLAALHDVDVHAVGLGDYGHPGNYFERQVSRWTRQYRAAETETLPDMERLMEWLGANLPEDDGRVSLIHGDYRLDNMIFHSRGADMIALVDWELSTLGHPFADLAYQCMCWGFGHEDIMKGLGDVDRAALGIPGDEEYIAMYCERRGLDGIPGWNFYLAFGHFRLAAILQGVLKRAIEGNASSDRAFAYGALAPRLAARAVAIIEQVNGSGPFRTR